MRAFVAVDVPELVPLPGLRPAHAEAPRHFTLRFLGDLEEGTVSEIDRALGSVAQVAAPFRVSISGIGAFPDWSRPRIVYAEAVEGRRELEALANAVNGALDGLGFAREARPFVPHVTLLRVRSPAEAARARALAAAALDRVLSAGPVDALLLKESELLPAGARHRAIGTYPLGLPR
ncbi:MAG TPA: RNA 2',3'-cyclic phosphodiesterase [Thermoplasmata archaeon]|nr:RNA 2',3'-cyclic phosphodiesterase [Thermoplasmata archaeon]